MSDGRGPRQLVVYAPVNPKPRKPRHHTLHTTHHTPHTTRFFKFCKPNFAYHLIAYTSPLFLQILQANISNAPSQVEVENGAEGGSTYLVQDDNGVQYRMDVGGAPQTR